jgi:hypothetical protein
MSRAIGSIESRFTLEYRDAERLGGPSFALSFYYIFDKIATNGI